MKNNEKMYHEAVQEGNKEFEYGTLPSLMKVQALQLQEVKAAKEHQQKRKTGSTEGGLNQDSD